MLRPHALSSHLNSGTTQTSFLLFICSFPILSWLQIAPGLSCLFTCQGLTVFRTCPRSLLTFARLFQVLSSSCLNCFSSLTSLPLLISRPFQPMWTGSLRHLLVAPSLPPDLHAGCRAHPWAKYSVFSRAWCPPAFLVISSSAPLPTGSGTTLAARVPEISFLCSILYSSFWFIFLLKLTFPMAYLCHSTRPDVSILNHKFLSLEKGESCQLQFFGLRIRSEELALFFVSEIPCLF